ncbi:putative beta-lysine N-acetyltransferase [Trichloromonas sp.]|uniref:putative beta-lysine N-acetyltransferase n=1 Tax=Trichloromonas sp. TaxID=3069249 RepID=UPI002A438955|nr:putative beta-lysine N-acetyltransferase [Trichloromonas sp.]
MMTDRIETFGQSTIQHGKHSDRVYLMKLGRSDLPELLTRLEELADEKGYSKIFAKVPDDRLEPFQRRGYRPEARVPGFYQGDLDAHFLGKYLCPQRREEPRPGRVAEVLALARRKSSLPEPPSLSGDYRWRPLSPDDTEAMVAVYRRVFASYPFPIHNPAYLARTMAENVRYHGIFRNERLVAIASAELDKSGENAEMTDFATLPDERGQGLANYLLTRLEETAANEGIVTAYTIARAYSFGMNITFAKHGYAFSGTLTRNTQISGELESMNVWYKPLAS